MLSPDPIALLRCGPHRTQGPNCASEPTRQAPIVAYSRRGRHPPGHHAYPLASLPPTHPPSTTTRITKSQNLHYLLKQSRHRQRPGRPQVAIAEQPGHGAASRRRMGGWTRHQIRCWRPAMILQGLQRRKAPLWLAHSIPSSMPARDGVMPTPSSRTAPRNRPPRQRQARCSVRASQL